MRMMLILLLSYHLPRPRGGRGGRGGRPQRRCSVTSILLAMVVVEMDRIAMPTADVVNRTPPRPLRHHCVTTARAIR